MCTVHIRVMAYMMQLNVKMAYVAGEVSGSIVLSERLTAASENLRLAPHMWQRVALAPTSVPHAGHSVGRPFSFLAPPNTPFICRLKRSIFQRRRGESGNQFPCEERNRISIIPDYEKSSEWGSHVTSGPGKSKFENRRVSLFRFLFSVFRSFSSFGLGYRRVSIPSSRAPKSAVPVFPFLFSLFRPLARFEFRSTIFLVTLLSLAVAGCAHHNASIQPPAATPQPSAQPLPPSVPPATTRSSAASHPTIPGAFSEDG